MISDSRDVFFQSDPFSYNVKEWEDSELVLFLETQPNQVSPYQPSACSGCSLHCLPLKSYWTNISLSTGHK